jgi:hypothetical protein
MKKLKTVALTVALLAGTANASKYTYEMGLGLGLMEYYDNNCQRMTPRGKKMAYWVDKNVGVKKDHYEDYDTGFDMGKTFGCIGLKEMWDEDLDSKKYAEMFFGKFK